MQTRELVSASFCWGIRSGQAINIWSSPWVPDVEGYQPKLKLGSLVDRRINSVCDLIEPTSNCWKIELINELFDDTAVQAILQIPLPSSPAPDVPRWLLSFKGVYSVWEAYLFDQKLCLVHSGELLSHEWKQLWRLKVQHRLKLLLWKVAAMLYRCVVG